MLIAILLVASFVLFFLAAIITPEPPRFRLGWAGAACLTLALLIKFWPA